MCGKTWRAPVRERCAIRHNWCGQCNSVRAAIVDAARFATAVVGNRAASACRARTLCDPLQRLRTMHQRRPSTGSVPPSAGLSFVMTKRPRYNGCPGFRSGHKVRLADRELARSLSGDPVPLTARLPTELALAAGLGRCLLYTSPSPRDGLLSRMPSSA